MQKFTCTLLHVVHQIPQFLDTPGFLDPHNDRPDAHLDVIARVRIDAQVQTALDVVILLPGLLLAPLPAEHVVRAIVAGYGRPGNGQTVAAVGVETLGVDAGRVEVVLADDLAGLDVARRDQAPAVLVAVTDRHLIVVGTLGFGLLFLPAIGNVALHDFLGFAQHGLQSFLAVVGVVDLLQPVFRLLQGALLLTYGGMTIF